jgi:ribosome-binding protein aMBF1 (putative translation factor)
MSKFSEYKHKKLQDPEFKKEYDALESEFDIIQAMIDARKQSGLTQKELAEKTGINQADISKLENGTANPSIRTLRRLADGMGMKMKLVFEPLSTH